MVTRNQIIGGTALGAGLIGGAIYVLSKRKTTKKTNKRKSKSRTKSKSSKSRTNYKKSKQRKPYTAGKRKDTSRRRIRFTKNNQPYVIMANGRARFIKKSSVRNARKRAGGRY